MYFCSVFRILIINAFLHFNLHLKHTRIKINCNLITMQLCIIQFLLTHVENTDTKLI